MKLIALAILGCSLAYSQEQVTLQINPVTTTAFDQMTGLDKLGAGLWNGIIRNSSTSTIKITWVDMQLGFPQVNFLTSTESTLLLTRKQATGFWTIVHNILTDAMVGAAAFYNPWFLVAQPIIQQIDPQLAALQPNVSSLLGQITTTSFTLAPADTAVIVMLAGQMAKANVHSYTHVMQVVPQPMVQPPALLREMPGIGIIIVPPTSLPPTLPAGCTGLSCVQVSWEAGSDYALAVNEPQVMP